MANIDLVAQPLGPQGGFNWVFLVELLLCGILAVFFLFYFNRLFATVISYGLRAYTWHKYRIYLDITSLQISLLGGRLFFKSIKYHGHNETILVHDGRITWRYWLRKVQEAEIFDEAGQPRNRSASESSESVNEKTATDDGSRDDVEAGGIKPQSALPCRFHVRVSGVEAFLYNHTPAYDGILSGLRPSSGDHQRQTSSSDPSSAHDQPNLDKAETEKEDLHPERTRSSNALSGVATNSVAQASKDSAPSYLQLFPVYVECRKAAAAVGNENTNSIVVAKVENASGRIDAGSSGPLDLFKILFLFDLTNVNVSLRSNQDFKEYQLQAAKRLEKSQEHAHKAQRLGFLTLRPLRRLFKRVRRLFASPRSGDSVRSIRSATGVPQTNLELKESDIPAESNWHGLDRFLDEDGNAQNSEWDNVDYARFSQIADISKISMKFYWDIPGLAHSSGLGRTFSGSISKDPNGSTPPDYGMSLAVHSGTVHYGPWADRQRLVLQHVFFPASYVDAVPQKPLQPDQTRLATIFNIHICLEEDVTVRIPTREPSKDWKWHGMSTKPLNPEKEQPGPKKRRGRHTSRSKPNGKRRQGLGGADMRPFGWFDITVKKDSVIKYTMDMYPRVTGFHNSLDVDVKGTEITSSVNHGLLWRAGKLTIQADLSNPLKWNALRLWTFNILCRDLDFFILRDHMFLLTDLISDWATGPPADFFTFVPFRYNLNLNFERFNIFLNSNDANIINNPADLDDNSFLILRGEDLHAELGIPIDRYRPRSSEITFDVVSRNMSLDLHNPSRNTLHDLLKSKQIAQLPKLTLKGTHTYFADQSIDLTDILQMEICGTGLVLQAYGFLIRHFINVKENYFGEFLHFKTLEEFQTDDANPSATVVEESERQNFRPSNDLDVILVIIVEQPAILLPANLYSAETCIRIDVPIVDVDLRVTNYYLDLQTNIGPLALSYVEHRDEEDESASAEQLRIGGAVLGGHRLFGLPPTEPVYMSTWDIDVGPVSGECSTNFLHHIAKAGRAFAYDFADLENAVPISDTLPVDDMTFVRLNTDTIMLWLDIAPNAICIAADPLSLEQDDAAGPLFSSRLTTRVPNLTLTCVEREDMPHYKMQAQSLRPERCLFFLQTTIDLAVIQRAESYREQRNKQQQHVKRHDLRGHRVAFLLNDKASSSKSSSDEPSAEPPAMFIPTLPENLHTSSGRKASTSSRLPEPPQDKTRIHSNASALLLGVEDQSCSGADRLLNNVHLTSAFAVPEMAYRSTRVNTSEIPGFSTLADEDDRSDDDPELSDDAEDSNGMDEQEAQVSIILRLEPGIRALVRPQVLGAAFVLASEMVPSDPADLFDAFQMDVMRKVEGALQQKAGNLTTLDLQFTVPSVDVRVIVEPDSVITSPASSETHQFDLSLAYATLALRSRTTPDIMGAPPTLVLHSSVESISLELAARSADSGRPRDIGSIRLDVEDVLVWSVLGQTQTVDASFKLLTALLSAPQADFLVSVLLRCFALASSTIDKATDLATQSSSRTISLIHYIGSHRGNTADPPYLAKMTYVLRAYPLHFRNQDSWKIVSRLRHAMQGFDTGTRNELESFALENTGVDVTSQQIRDDWADWCAWDVPRLEETQLFNMLFPTSLPGTPASVPSPLRLSLHSGVMRVVVDNSNPPSEIAIVELGLDVSIQPPTEPSGLMLVDENLRTMTTIQATSAAVFGRLKWDLLAMVDPLLQAIEEQIKPATKSKTSTTVAESSDSTISRQDFHFVFSTDNGSVILETINLQHVSSSQNFQISLVGTSRAAVMYGQCLSVLASADQAGTELRQLRASQQRVWRTVLTKPSLYVDFRHFRNSSVAELNIGGSYGEMKINVEQEILGLIAIIESVFTDEVARVLGLIEKSKTFNKVTPPQEDQNHTPGLDLHVKAALLAGAFSVDVAVLQSLTISVSGETANLRITPLKEAKMALDLQMQVGPVRYAAVSKESDLSAGETMFFTPATGTSVKLRLGEDSVNVNISSVLEEMNIEAASIQNIFTVLRRPEVQSVMEAVQHSVNDLEVVIKTSLGRKDMEPIPEKSMTKKKREVAYNVNVTSAGVKVSAKAPVTTHETSEARLVFGLGLVQVLINNDSDSSTERSTLPKVYVKLDSLFAKLDLRSGAQRIPCASVNVGVVLCCTPASSDSGHAFQDIDVKSHSLDIEISPATPSTIIDVMTHIQRKIIDLDLSKEVEHLKRIGHKRRKFLKKQGRQPPETVKATAQDKQDPNSSTALAVANLSINLNRIRLAWVVNSELADKTAQHHENLELTLAHVEFTLKQQHQARLTIQNLQLQLVPKSHKSFERSLNSALMPEMVFTVMFESPEGGIRLAFQAVGQALDLRLDSRFVAPITILAQSFEKAVDEYRLASTNWKSSAQTENVARTSPFGERRLQSLLVDISFAGATLYMQGQAPRTTRAGSNFPTNRHGSVSAAGLNTTLQAPGVAMKVEFTGEIESRAATLKGELKVEASSNTVYPELVPIILQMSDHAKDAVREAEEKELATLKLKSTKSADQKPAQRLIPNENLLETNPILAKTKLSFGIRICKQEFGLSCQPIARVNAKVQIDDIYITMNTMDPEDDDRFFALSAAFTNFGASVQHVYSRESTFSFDLESLVLSVMNSKHLGAGSSGLSAILKVAPMKTWVNARQLQDLLLFREIWLPSNLRDDRTPNVASPAEQPEEFMVQRYRQVATATAFPLAATVFFEDLSVNVDFGQSIGKSSASVKNLWASSTKSSGWKQDLCIGIDSVSANSVGRMGGFIELSDLDVRTSIEWPDHEDNEEHTPLIQASAGFANLRVKAAFDYQPFAFADIEGFNFMMYNVREEGKRLTDRLVAVLDGGRVFAFCTSTSPAQAVGLFQAFERLIQEKQAAYKQSLSDLEKQLQRPSISHAFAIPQLRERAQTPIKEKSSLPIRLRTDVMVSLRTICVGAFPATFFDSQILKLEASDVTARFIVGISPSSQIHSDLSMTLGQLQVALASVKKIRIPKTLGDISVDEVITNSVAAKGGVILRVPRVVASMQTWQSAESKKIDFVFKSKFEGKVDIGWNYSRISFIRGMWNTHSRSLAARLGKPLPESAVKITANGAGAPGETGVSSPSANPTEGEERAARAQADKEEEAQEALDRGKITAVVNMPLSKYEYHALEPPVVETPQLRDMGEATPPLEWIGLHRERLPNVVHQVVIVTLLEVAKEVEDAYGRILGAS